MFDWLKRRDKNQKLPEYSAAGKMPSRGVPCGLSEQEAKEAFSRRRDSFERWLCEPPRRPQPESQLFVEILNHNREAFVTIERSAGSHCLVVFSSRVRAAEYMRTLLPSESVNYLSSSPLELVTLLRDAREVGIDGFTLDRCPRCDTFNVISNASTITIDDIITCWSVVKAMELARLELHLTYAQACARAQQFYSARDVLLEAAAHVSLEDPRLHWSLGQVAVALYDDELLREVKSFLRFFELKSWEGRLDRIAESRSLDLDFVGDAGEKFGSY